MRDALKLPLRRTLLRHLLKADAADTSSPDSFNIAFEAHSPKPRS